MNTVGSRTRLVGRQEQEKWGADSENLMLLVMQPCTTYLFFCDGTNPRCNFPPYVSFWRTWLCPLRHCCTLQQSALHSDAYVKSSGINVALIYQAISGWVLLFGFILLLAIVFILLYCIQPTSLFHLILMKMPLNNVISRSKKRSDAICGLHFFPQPNKTIHHFRFSIISNLKLLEKLPVNHFRSSLDNARKGWLDLVSIKLLDSSLVPAQLLCWEIWWKCGLRSGGMWNK